MNAPIYVYRPLLQADRLAQYAEAIGLQNVVPAEEMHVTITYSRAAVDWNKPEFIPDPTTIIASGGKREIIRLDDGAVALEFYDRIIAQRWAKMIMAGASFDHERFIPHVTLAYDENVDVAALIAPTADLRFGPEHRKPLDENWTSGAAA